MKTVSFIVCVLFVVGNGRMIERNSLYPRIVNGQDAKLGERPFQVSLQDLSHFCGGSILNKQWVVTAGHCVMDRVPSEIKVVVGTVNLDKPYASHISSQIIIHEGYSHSSQQHDIALIKVNIPFEFSSRVQPVALPEAHFIVKTNSSAVLSGWGGQYDSSSPIPNTLETATIFIADQEYCQKVMLEWSKMIYRTNVCAYDPSMRRGQCSGDSGGPLTVDGKLTGVVSWSVKDPICASTKYPGVYTRVSEYIDWMREHAK